MLLPAVAALLLVTAPDSVACPTIPSNERVKFCVIATYVEGMSRASALLDAYYKTDEQDFAWQLAIGEYERPTWTRLEQLTRAKKRLLRKRCTDLRDLRTSPESEFTPLINAHCVVMERMVADDSLSWKAFVIDDKPSDADARVALHARVRARGTEILRADSRLRIRFMLALGEFVQGSNDSVRNAVTEAERAYLDDVLLRITLRSDPPGLFRKDALVMRIHVEPGTFPVRPTPDTP